MPDSPTPSSETKPATPADAPPTTAVADLTCEDIDALFRDLAACADLLNVAVKCSPNQGHANPAAPDLAHARFLLDQPTTHAVQLRYRYEGDLWIDTLTQRGDGYQLVRVQH